MKRRRGGKPLGFSGLCVVLLDWGLRRPRTKRAEVGLGENGGKGIRIQAVTTAGLIMDGDRHDTALVAQAVDKP